MTDDHPVDAIEWAADQGITLGCDDAKFCPDQPLKRKHARVFIERFYDQVLGAGGDDQFTNHDFTRTDMMGPTPQHGRPLAGHHHDNQTDHVDYGADTLGQLHPLARRTPGAHPPRHEP